MEVILGVLLTLVIGAISVWYAIFYKYERYLGKYPGPQLLPVLGSTLHFGNIKGILKKFVQFNNEYGPITKLYIGYYPRLLVTDLKMVEFILGSNSLLEKSSEYRLLHDWIGTGLLTSSSTKWRKNRKLMTPAFHFQILEQLADSFDAVTNILVDKLRKEVGKESVNIFPYMSLSALDIICEASMGTSINAQRDSESEYVNSVQTQTRILMERSVSVTKKSETLYKLYPEYQEYKRTLKVLHDYTDFVIQKRREELIEEKRNEINSGNHENDVGVKKRLTFLDLLLCSQLDGKSLPNDVIRDEVDTIMFEGHDTTSSGTSFALYSLANNPEIQKKVVEELNQIYSDDKNRPTSLRDLQEMKYLELVLKECMRLYPPVPVIGRYTDQDFEYNGDIIPKGVDITLFIFGAHRDPKYFPDPEKFDPERFTSANFTGQNPYMYIPFSAGPRNCIGQKFAMLEMKATVAKVLRHFELLPAVPEHKPILLAQAILNSANGVCIQLKERS